MAGGQEDRRQLMLRWHAVTTHQHTSSPHPRRTLTRFPTPTKDTVPSHPLRAPEASCPHATHKTPTYVHTFPTLTRWMRGRLSSAGQERVGTPS